VAILVAIDVRVERACDLGEGLNAREGWAVAIGEDAVVLVAEGCGCCAWDWPRVGEAVLPIGEL
jgi:hypothetical protein